MALQTRIFKEGEDLFTFCCEEFKKNNIHSKELEGSILAVTSKIVSLAEKQVISAKSISKEELVRREADQFLGEIAMGCFLTIKHGLFIPSAGVDESNSENSEYILFPKDPFKSAIDLKRKISAHYKLQNFAILLTDSHTSPLRAGVTGITLAHAGLRAVENKIGDKDLFGRTLKMTQVNVADALSTTAVYCMGETSESSPLALLKAPVTFIPEEEENPKETFYPPEEDLYYPLYKQLLR